MRRAKPALPAPIRGFLLLAALSAEALAGDGRIEINQARALAGGVTPLDSPGFPVTLSADGSYLLTSDLTPGPGVAALELRRDGIAIDLNGFTLRGSGSGGAAASGIVSPLFSGLNVTIRNGTIQDFLGRGIDLATVTGIEVRDVLVSDNAQGGIALGDGGLVADVRAARNGPFGLSLAATTAFTGIFVSGSTGTDVIGGVQIGPSYCEDGSCWARPPRRRFYLSTVAATGAQAPTRCATGFHFASLWEIRNPGILQYDTSLGHAKADSGESAPVGDAGWARTGNPSRADASGGWDGGYVNCNSWTSASASDMGAWVRLPHDWNFFPGGYVPLPIWPWHGGNSSCSTPLRVWCVED